MIAWYWLVAWMVSLIVLDALYEYRRNQDDKFWEAQRDNWENQRQTLLDRIQAPSLSVYKALEKVPALAKEPKPEAEKVDPI